MIVLQLIVLLGIFYTMLCLGVVVFAIFVKLDSLISAVSKLYNPSKDEIIDRMTTAEAQTHAIRAEAIIMKWIKIASKIIANDVGKVMSGK